MLASDVLERPIFVIGPQRCGSTLLGRVLASTERTAFTVNGKLLYYLLYWLQPRSTLPDWSHFRADELLFSIERKPILGVPDDFVSEVVAPVVRGVTRDFANRWAESSTDASDWKCFAREVVSRIYGELAQAPSFWGDKYNEYLLVSERLLELFPEARFIACERDPASVGNSMRRAFSERAWCPDTAVLARRKYESWVRCWKSLADTLGPERSLTVNYERLCTSPDSTLRTVADFAGLPFKELAPCLSWIRTPH